MSHLKTETVNKCFSLLREYIEAASPGNRKEIAILALNQLRTITAGEDPGGDIDLFSCNGQPRVYAS